MSSSAWVARTVTDQREPMVAVIPVSLMGHAEEDVLLRRHHVDEHARGVGAEVR